MSKVAEIIKQQESLGFKFADEKIQTFEQGFLSLKAELEQANDNQLNDNVYRGEFIKKFDKLLVGLGYNEFDPDSAENLLNDLYFTDEYEFMMMFITTGYRSITDSDVLCLIYDDMMDNMAREYHDEWYLIEMKVSYVNFYRNEYCWS